MMFRNLFRGCRGGVLAIAAGVLPAPCRAEAPSGSSGGETPCVLVIGIDGLRSDALQSATTEHIDRLIAEGHVNWSCRVTTDRYTASDTVSGPGWTTFLTGVWADKHGVNDNKFEGRRDGDFPNFLVRVRNAKPGLRTLSALDWTPLDTYVPADADYRFVVRPPEDSGAQGYNGGDEVLAAAAAEALSAGDPRVAFVYFGVVDETGHAFGFHPSVPQYRQAIEQTDQRVGRLVAALQNRPGYVEEDWLILLSTDHGGEGRGHGGNRGNDVVCRVPLIVSGPAAARDAPQREVSLTDIVATALVHLDVTIDPSWQLDGTAEGLLRSGP